MNKSEITKNVERAIKHDQAAIEALYKFTYDAAYAFTYNLCHNHNDVEDILQESYISAFSSLYKINNKGNFWNWLKGIILNKWRDYCRDISSSYYVMIYESAIDDDIEYWQLEASVQNMVENQELSRTIRNTVEQLPEKQRICAVLYYYNNLTLEEIADKLKIPLGSVKSRLYYARKKIQKMLRQENLLSVGSAASAAAAEGSGLDLLTKILAALEKHATVSKAANNVSGGFFLKLLISFVSVSIAGIAGAKIALPQWNEPEAEPVITVTLPSANTSVTTAVTVAATHTTAETTSTTTTVTTASTTVTTTTTLPQTYVSFEYAPSDGGICITKYTGNEGDVYIPAELNGQRVVAIGSKAFANCAVLRSVVIPTGVNSIGVDAFRECDNLYSISLGSVSSIGDMAFVGCDSLGSVHLPSSVRSVGIYAFAYCSSLSKVVISQGTANIRYNAFCECPNLQSVTLPPSVSKMGADVFVGTSKNLVLYVTEGSYSHQYAVENSITYGFN